MRRLAPLAAGLLAVLTWAACGPSSQDNAHVQTLPNSLADTSAHVARRAIPSYGPADAVRTDTVAMTPPRMRGQVLYVPVYSHIFQRSADRQTALTATLSIRNTSRTEPLQIREVDYFDSDGTLLTSYLEGASRTLGPLASTYVVIEEGDLSGGVGANFIVTWEGEQALTAPVVEAVMLSTANAQGISFVSRARVVETW